MHGDDGGLVRVKVDEAITGWLASELIGHDLEGMGVVVDHDTDVIDDAITSRLG